MAGEIALKYPQTGLTVKVEVCPADAHYVWSGTAFVLYSALANTAAWQAGLVALTEQTLADATATGHYVGNFSGFSVGQEYTLRFYQGASPLPGDPTIGQQTVRWTGAAIEAIQSGDTYGRLGAPAGASVSADVAALKADLDGRISQTLLFTGQLVQVDVKDVDGTAWHSATAGRIGANLSTMFDVATQNFTGASINQTGDTYAIAKSGGSGDLGAIKVKTDLITTSNVTTLSPISGAGSLLSLLVGETYSTARGSALVWSRVAGAFPDITGATVTLEAANHAGTVVVNQTGSVTTSGAGAQSVTVEVPKATTAALIPSTAAGSYTVWVQWSDGTKRAFANGSFVVVGTINQ